MTSLSLKITNRINSMYMKFLLPVIVLLLSGCAVKHPLMPEKYDPSQHARLRVGIDWVSVGIYFNQDCYDDDWQRAQLTSITARGMTQVLSRSIGMPESDLIDMGAYSEFVMPANMPITLSQRGGGTVPGGNMQSYTTPWHYPVTVVFEAGKDYELWSYQRRPVVRELIVVDGKVTGGKILKDLPKADACDRPPMPPQPMPRGGQDVI